MHKPTHSLEWMGRISIGQHWHLHPLSELVRVVIVFYMTLNHDITLFRFITMLCGTTPHIQSECEEYYVEYCQNILMDLNNVMSIG